MGHRANLIIVENQKYELYYDHWCARNIEQHTFWGEARTVEFIRSHELSSKTIWLDDVWCEGGILVDLDHKVLLFFGGEYIAEYFIRFRLVLMDLLAFNWQGYDIRWAWRGIADFADYVGYDKEPLISPIKEVEITDNPYDDLHILPNSCSGIVGYEKDDEIFLYPSTHLCASDVLKYGLTLFDLLDKVTPCIEYTMPEDDVLMWGIHINESTKEISYWVTKQIWGHLRLFDENWPNFVGWRVHWLENNYQQYLDWLGDQLTYPTKTTEEWIEIIKRVVCSESIDPVESMVSAMSLLEKAGHKVKMVAEAFQTKPFKESEDIETDEEKFDRLVELYIEGKQRG